MLPGSTDYTQAARRGGKIDGRSVEIQRLIGRSSRRRQPRQVSANARCGSTATSSRPTAARRTAAINGAFVALVDALIASRDLLGPIPHIVRDSVAAVSVGLVLPAGLERRSNCSTWTTSRTATPTWI